MCLLMFEILVVVWPGKFCATLREGLRECTFEVDLIPRFISALSNSTSQSQPSFNPPRVDLL